MAAAANSPVVMITRPEPDGPDFAQAVSAAGFRAVMCPVLEIAFLESPLDLTNVSALAFTSANGVRAFQRRTARRDFSVFAVGAVTAQAAADAGFDQVVAAGGDVDDLAAVIIARRNALTGRLVHVAGSERRGELVTLLETAGVSASRRVIYTATAVEQLSADGRTALNDADVSSTPTVVTFFSPRSSVLFLRQIERASQHRALQKLTAVCLSAAVAAELTPTDWRCVAIADRRDANSVLIKIKQIFSSLGA